MSAKPAIEWLSTYWPYLAGYAANTVVTLLITIPKTRTGFWRVIRILHGALNRLDPEGNSE